MRIAIFTDTYPPFINGVSTSTYNLVKVLEAHGHQTLVVTPRSDDGKLEIKDNVIYIPGIALKKIYGYRLTTLYSSSVFNYIKNFKPDLVHNQTDVTRTKNNNFLTRHKSLDIDVFLRCTSRINPCWTRTCYVQSTSTSLTATHRQNHRFCLQSKNTARCINGCNFLILCQR